jgi:arylsulfatase A-like enzyme
MMVLARLKKPATFSSVVFLPLFVCLFAAFSAAAGGEAKRRPNILFILTDNQAASLIGAYGNRDINTPNIDRLAAEGVKFTNAFAVNGMCSATRATLMTGLMPSQHGVHNWLDDAMLKQWPRDWSAVAEFRTLPWTLQESGYQTAMIGKWHLGQPWKPSIGYQHWVTFADGHTTDFWDNQVIDNQRQYRVRDRHIVDYFTDKAVEYLDDYQGDQPFYLQLNYDGPYVNPPTNMGPARNRFYSQYLEQDFKSFPESDFHPNLEQQEKDFKAQGQESAFLNKIIKMSRQMHGDQTTRANIASQNTLVDDGVGRVMEALRRNGLDENTLVVFSTDQGNFYGQHGLWTHTVITTPSNLYDTAMQVPLIFWHKGELAAGIEEAAMIGQYDIPRTLLDYVGLGKVPLQNSPGQSFVETLRGQQHRGREAVFFEQEETRGIRTQRFSYWKRLDGTGQPELYDLANDPQQQRNVIGDPQFARQVRHLDQQLVEFFQRYSDEQYDLWRGGVAKGSVARPETFQALYGEDWAPVTEVKPVYHP